MEYQKVITLLDKTTTKPSKSTAMLNTSLCNYSDSYIFLVNKYGNMDYINCRIRSRSNNLSKR